MIRLEDVLMDPSMADLVRQDLQRGRERLEQSVINYRFGMQMFGTDLAQVEPDLFLYIMIMTVMKEFDAREPGDAKLPMLFSIMAMKEMTKHDQ